MCGPADVFRILFIFFAFEPFIMEKKWYIWVVVIKGDCPDPAKAWVLACRGHYGEVCKYSCLFVQAENTYFYLKMQWSENSWKCQLSLKTGTFKKNCKKSEEIEQIIFCSVNANTSWSLPSEPKKGAHPQKGWNRLKKLFFFLHFCCCWVIIQSSMNG